MTTQTATPAEFKEVLRDIGVGAQTAIELAFENHNVPEDIKPSIMATFLMNSLARLIKNQLAYAGSLDDALFDADQFYGGLEKLNEAVDIARREALAR